jgi:myo-inositol-1-phosphate synthase
MPHLASFFKEPLGVEEHSLFAQFRLLLDYVERAGRGEASGMA